MNRHFTIFCFLLVVSVHISGQNMGFNTQNPDPSALVDMGQMPRGLLVPRMTQAERMAISNPSNALIVFQTDHPAGFYYYDMLSSQWKPMTGSNNVIRDTDNDTRIQTEAIPDEDIIRIQIRGQEKLVLQKNLAAAYGRIDMVNNQGNILIGDSTLANAGINARDNIAVQSAALKNNTAGKDNIGIGTSVLSVYDDDNAIGIGFEALKNAISTDLYNIALGYRSNINGGGDASVIIGSEASPKSSYNTTISIGKASGFNNTTAFLNIMIGAESMYNVNNADNNVAIGFRSMYNNQLNWRNVMIGSESGHRGTENTGIGYKTLTAVTADQNIAVGSQALSLHQTGDNNYAAGFSALKNHVNGRNNIALGSYALEGNTNGGHNIGVGFRALFADAGKYNIAIGSNAFSVSGGNSERNVVIGAETQTNSIPGNNNVIVGYNAAVAPGVDNAVVIGSHAYAESSNAVILGSVAGKNGATETVRVGLGTSSPHPSAIFEMKSANKPFLMPAGILNAHPDPAEGLMFVNSIYTYFYNGTEWVNMNESDAMNGEGAQEGESFVVRNQQVVKGYPNAIQDGTTTISKATIEENINDNKFRLKLNGDPVLTIGENANGQLIMETLSNDKSILSGIYDVGSSMESTVLCKLNDDAYADGSTIAGDYVLYQASGLNFTGLGLHTFANFGTTSQDNAESVGIGFETGMNMNGNGYTIAGNHVTEQIGGSVTRNDILVVGHAAQILADNENATLIGHDAILKCSNCVVLGNEKIYPVTSDQEQDVGIGTTTPRSALHLYGPGTVDHPHLRLEKTNVNPVNISFRNPVNNVQNFMNAEPAVSNNNAEFSLGTTTNGMMLRLFGNGNATIVSLAQSSDSTLKTNIKPLTGSLQRLAGIRPIHYEWKDSQRSKKIQTGFSAQDVEKSFPELTGKDDEGFSTVNYQAMNAVLWQSLQELTIKSEEQLQQLEEQEAKLQELSERLEKLKNKQNLTAYEKVK